MPAKTLQHIVDGKNEPIDIALDTLKRLANHLGLPLQSLFAAPQPPPPPPPQSTDVDPVEDATTVIAVLYDRGTTPTVNQDLALALGWDMTRLGNAYDEAEKRLTPAGLTLNRTHGECSVVPTHDHAKQRTALTNALSDRSGAAITMDGYTAAHQVMTGSPILPTTTGMRRRFVLGAIANIGIITLQAREPALTEAALEAFPN